MITNDSNGFELEKLIKKQLRSKLHREFFISYSVQAFCSLV